MKLPPLPSLTGALAASLTLVVGASVFYVVTAPEQAIFPQQTASPELSPVPPTPTASVTPQEASEAPDTATLVPSPTPTAQPPSRPSQTLQPIPSVSLVPNVSLPAVPTPLPSPSLCVDLLGNVIVCVELP